MQGMLVEEEGLRAVNLNFPIDRSERKVKNILSWTSSKSKKVFIVMNDTL